MFVRKPVSNNEIGLLYLQVLPRNYTAIAILLLFLREKKFTALCSAEEIVFIFWYHLR